MTAGRIWLVWSNEHGAFWRPQACGYTVKIDEAGRYTEEEARQHCTARDSGRKGIAPEVMVPAPEALRSLPRLYGLVQRGIALIGSAYFTDEHDLAARSWLDEAKSQVATDAVRLTKERA